MTYRAVSALTIVSFFSAVAVFAAVPASAAELPEGASISIVDWESGVVYDVNAANAEVTSIGTATGIEYVTGIDVNDDGIGFAVTGPYGDDDPPSELYAANTVDGTLTYIATITVAGDEYESVHQCASLDLAADGTLYTGCLADWGDGTDAVIGTLDPLTGVLTVLDYYASPDGLLYALASHPTTGLLYGFSETTAFAYDHDDESFGVDILTEDLGSWIYGADFDANGVLWVTSWDEEVDYDILATLGLDVWVVDAVGQYQPTDETEFSVTEAITVWGQADTPEDPDPVDPVEPAETLPATGFDQTPMLLLGAALLVLAGLASIATARYGKIGRA